MSQDLRVPLDQINSLNDDHETVNPVPVDQTPPQAAPPNAEVIIDMTPGGESPDLARELSLSMEGTETVVFKQDIPESADVVALRTMIRTVSAILVGSMITVFTFGYLILGIYNSKVPDFTKVFWMISVLLSIKIIVHLTLVVAATQNDKDNVRPMADSITNLFIVQVFMFYLSGDLPAQTFQSCLYANLALQFLKIAVFGIGNHCPDYTVAMLEAVTMLFTGLKLVSPAEYGSWSIILLYYVIAYYLLNFVMILAGMVIVLMTLAIVFQRNDGLGRLNFETYLAGVTIWGLLFVITFGISQFYYGTYTLLIQNAIIPNPSPITTMPFEYYLAGNIMMWLAAIIAGIVLMVNTCFMQAIFRRMKPMQGKEISLKTYAKAFILELKKISGNYFRRNQEAQIPPTEPEIRIQETEVPLDECVVCQTMPSCFLLFPCNHCVLCIECVKPFLESQSNCPICKEPIQKCSHIAFDEGKNTYMVDFSYKLKNY
jgi:hypothetical protein